MAELPPPAPPTASARRYLRDGLPAVYRDDDLAMALLEELERTLDGIVSLLDSLPAHFDRDVAPDDLVELMGAWLGLDPPQVLAADPAADGSARRALALRGVQLTRRRGTRTGLEEELRLAFPALDIRVWDSGGVTQGPSADGAPAANEPWFKVVVANADAVSASVETLLRRMVRRIAPAHVPGRLQIGRRAEVVPL